MSRWPTERSPFDPGRVTHLTTPHVETSLMTYGMFASVLISGGGSH
jgi:hypothetical protein